MKHLFNFLILSLLVFSCNDKVDIENSVLLKNYVTSYKDENITKNINTFLTYSNGEISSLLELYSKKEDGKEIEEVYGESKLELINVDSIVYEVYFNTYISSFIYPSKVLVTKTNNYYNCKSFPIGSFQNFWRIETNSQGQMIRNLHSNSFDFSIGSVFKKEDVDVIERFEYDKRGNISKIYITQEFRGKEYLFCELTYDNNPNPLKVLKWINRAEGLSSFRLGFLSENNNNATSIKYQLVPGTIEKHLDVKISYTYNSKNTYPKACKRTYEDNQVAFTTYFY
ncbi:MAG: hypothetical protein ACRCVT_00140 [Leadbetterella sp.]